MSRRFDDEASATAVAPAPNGNGKHPAQAKSAPVSFIPRDAHGNTIESPLYLTGRRSEATRVTAYAVAAYAYIAMRYRAEAVSEAPLMVVEETEDGEEWIQGHDLDDILDQPSPDYDMGELLYLTRIYRDMTGQAIWIKDADRAGRVGRLTPYHAEEFEVGKTDERIFGRFRLVGRNEWLEPERVVFFREPNPADWWRGLGWVEVALRTLNLGQAVTATARELLRNAVFPSAIAQAHHEWNPDDDEWEKFKAELDAHAAAENKGRVLALTGGGKVTVVATKIEELLPGELLDRVESVVAACSGIPAIVLQYHVGIKNSPWSQMEEARRMAYEDAIERLWKRDEKALTRQLLRDVDEDPTHYIRFDRSRIRALKVDDAKRASVVAQLRDVWTIDQALIYTGQEPHPDPKVGGQIIGQAGAAVGAGSLFRESPTAPDGSAPDDPDRPADTDTDTAETVDVASSLNGAQITAALEVLQRLGAGSIGRDAAVELLVAVGIARDNARRMVADQPTIEAPQESAPAAKAAPLAAKSDGLRASAIRLTQRGADEELDLAVARLLAEDQAEVARLAGQIMGGPAAAKADGPTQDQQRRFLSAVRRYLEGSSQAAWLDAVEPLLQALGIRAAEALAADIGINLQLLRPDVLRFAEREAAWLVKEISATTRDAIADAISAGVEAGEGSMDIARRLQDLPAFDRDRAKLVARTETTRVMNGAPTEALKAREAETGRRYQKTWHAVLDDRTRDEHADMHGETVPIGAAFSNGLEYPSEPNCRCVLLTSAVEGL